jgi:hypothetical protein
MTISVRPYEAEDAVPTWLVYHSAVRRTGIRDYSEAQVRAWAPDDVDAEEWAARRASAYTVVACEGDRTENWIRGENLPNFAMHYDIAREVN